MRLLGLEDTVVEEDDGALWDAQRAAQRGDCVLKVSGRITDLPEGTVKSRLHRARMALRKKLLKHL